MPKLTITQGEKSTDILFDGRPVLSSVLQEHGFSIDMPCGGRGVCGKCRVEASGGLSPLTAKESAAGTRLACQTILFGDAQVRLIAKQFMENIAASGERPLFVPDPLQDRFGMAVDIGTTTLAATLLDLTSGQVLATATAENPQRSIAADVIGRIEGALAGKSDLLQSLIKHAINGLRIQICSQADIKPGTIDKEVITGNTTMLYLYTGKNPEPLSHAPFHADCLFGHWSASQAEHTYLPHCISAFIGADITCAILASGICRRDETALLVDIGTNGEIALWHEGKLYVCATAAGPAFEGGGLEFGCGSIAGAIDHVWPEDGSLAFSTIAGAEPVGICGSGIIDTLQTLIDLGQLDETGLLCQERVHLKGQIAITQKDVRNVQLAKSAIAAGILTLCQSAGVNPDEVAVLYLAGGFGKYINLHKASAIGLIPQGLISKTKVIGNASLIGAEMLLLKRAFLKETENYARTSRVVTLSGNPEFTDNYISCMTLEPI